MNTKKILFLTLAIIAAVAIAISINNDAPTQKQSFYCTLELHCREVAENMDMLKSEKADIIPADGVIYSDKKVEFYDGESVFDVLEREMKQNKIHLDFERSATFGSTYVKGIGNLYSFDCGDMSGWLYKVNGESPSVGCSEYILKDGDTIEFYYSCDMSKDM